MGIEIIGVVFGVVILLLVSRRFRRRVRYWRPDFGQGEPRRDAKFKSRDDRVVPPRPDYADPAEQLRIVNNTGFSAKRVMSFGEYGVFKIVEQEAAAVQAGFRVFAQTSLGEVLESTSTEGFKAINSKRVDVLVVGPTGLPVLAIEHQGEGHYQGTGAIRDAVKKEALRKAGVECLEISGTHPADDTRIAVRAALRRVIDRDAASAAKSNVTVLPAATR